MRTPYSLISIGLFALILIAIFTGQNAAAEDGSCYLKASNKDVFVIVSEPDIDQPFRSGADKACYDLDTVDIP